MQKWAMRDSNRGEFLEEKWALLEGAARSAALSTDQIDSLIEALSAIRSPASNRP
jgi:hypothetical protein